jgi:hypothetical protein
MGGTGIPGCNFPHVVSTTEDFIRDFICDISVTHNDLLAFSNHHSTNSSRIMCCPFTAPTKSFNLQGMNAIGQFN